MEVDRSAPAVADAETEIAADPETVWEVLTDLEGWPRWNPDVSSVRLDGRVEPGATFTWKAGRATITSTIRKTERPSLIGWTGKTAGIDAIHVWRLEPSSDGVTVSMQESFSGLVAKLLRKRLQRDLDATTTKGLEALKAAAERP